MKLASGGAVNLSGAELFDNVFDGVLARGGRASGDNLRIVRNGGFGIRVERGGAVDFTRTEAQIVNNHAGRYYVEQGTGCASPFDPCHPPAALIIK